MPEVSRFRNVIIRMQYSDDERHHKPHVHVVQGDYEASVGIDGEVLSGSLPAKTLRMVSGWLAFHEDELYAAWNKAVRNEPFDRIPPLQ